MSEAVRLAHHEHGDPAGPPVVLVHGLGSMGAWWPPRFVARLAEECRVIVVDLRDSGASPSMDHLGAAQPVLDAWAAGDRVPPPYTLADVAGDVVALLDDLGIDDAHVVGQSMGGMVAQHLAFGHPQRVRSLTSISSTTGSPSLPSGEPAVVAALFEETPAADEESYVAAAVASARALSPSPLFDAEEAERRYRAYWRNGLDSDGGARHGVAVLADGDRTERLATVRVPTLVVHGDLDPLLPAAGGRATAGAVPGATYIELTDVGHELPGPVQQQVADAIIDHVVRAEETTGRRRP